MFQSLLDLLRQTATLPLGSAPAVPDMVLSEDERALELRVRLPGIDRKSVQVQVTESSVAIAGYGTVAERTEGPDFYRVQAGASSFYRAVPLPVRIDPHRAAMHWQADGSLLVTLPKRDGAGSA